jgi:pilus assembly protein Flp/PilA
MEKMWTLIKKLAKEEEGMETVEYAVVAALVIVAGIVIWSTLGSAIKTKVNALITAMGGTAVP